MGERKKNIKMLDKFFILAVAILVFTYDRPDMAVLGGLTILLGMFIVLNGMFIMLKTGVKSKRRRLI